MSLAMKARQRVKKKTVKDKIFGCDLLEHLQMSGQEVPQVLRSCTEFVEEHGIVDGIYRLCGIASNVQKLRQEFDIERPPDLNKSTYLQDVHCVSSLCKAYFRELPNPLLTYRLYDKFADAVAIQLEEQRLIKIREVLQELPPQHYRTLEYLMRHLLRMASYSNKTNMHARNLAIVWAPNLLRSKDIESSGFNGTAAFMEVRVQSIVVEFILTHVEQLFGDFTSYGKENEGSSTASKNWLMPTCVPEDYYRSLSYNLPNMLNQGDGPPQIRPYHTIIEFSDHKRKGSLKAKKWKSIFNLGRSNPDSKRKSQKQDDKDGKSGKMSLRPAKSMDSLSSVPHATHSDMELSNLALRSPRNQLSLRRESLGSPSKEENVEYLLLDSDEQPYSLGTNDAEYDEEEGQAKSEPTTPKSGRSSMTGNPPGRSPKSNASRAEKCVGVHISGPFSVTLPFHITSNLSRLTRGMECPGLNIMSPHRESEKFLSTEGNLTAETKDTDKERLSQEPDMHNDKPIGTECSTTEEHGKEDERISLEVQDTFSFLDTQDTSTEKTPETTGDNEMLEYNLHVVNMMEEFSVEPPPDDLCTEHEAEQAYFMPIGFVDEVGQWREMKESLEDIFLSAHDDLSPIRQNPGKWQENLESSSEENRTEQHDEVHENLLSDTDPREDTLQDVSYSQELPESPMVSGTQCNWTQNIMVDDQNGQCCNPDNVKTEEQDTCRKDVGTPSNEEPGFREGYNMVTPNPENTAAPMAPIEMQQGLNQDDKSVNSEVLEDSSPPSVQEKAEEHHRRPSQGEDMLDAPVTSQQAMAIVHSPNIVISKAALENGVSGEESHDGGNTNNKSTSDHYGGHEETAKQQSDGTDGSISEWQRSSNDDDPHFVGQDHFCDQTNMRTIESLQSPPHVSSLPDKVDSIVPDHMYPDGSVAMKLMATTNKIQQIKSVPVVPPKPQFAKLPSALKSKIHVCSSSSSANRDMRSQMAEKMSCMETAETTSDSTLKRRSSWRNTTSISFDTAMALAKERQSQNPVRRMQTYCIGDSLDIMDTCKSDNASHASRFTVKPASSRTLRPYSCISVSCGEGDLHNTVEETTRGLQAIFTQEPDTYSKEVPHRNRLSMPRLGQPSVGDNQNKCHQQRRSLL